MNFSTDSTISDQTTAGKTKGTLRSPLSNRRGSFLILVGAMLLLSFLWVGGVGAVTQQPAPTLVPPTLVPPPPTATPYPAISRTALARIRERTPATLVVGTPANRLPFAAITDTGDYEGFEADILRAIAEDWGIRLEFRQVTKKDAYGLLQAGTIDVLIGGQIISRDAPDFLDFSDPYFVNRQVALAMADTPGDVLSLNGQIVGVVVGSAGEAAFGGFSLANGMNVTVNRYAMMDDAIRALGAREITALVGDRWDLDQRVRGKIEGVRLMDGTFRSEPYGIAMLRYDDHLRTLINRTLQRLVKSDRLKQIFDRWFPPDLMPSEDRVYPLVWADLDADTRAVNCAPGGECQAFPVDIVRPARSVIEIIQTGGALRVAGLGEPPDARGTVSILETFNAALIYEMARRWGVGVMIVPGAHATAEDALASGNADLAINVKPHWGTVDRVDFVGWYAERGYRMLVRVGSPVENFGSLRLGKRVIGTFADDSGAFEIARRLAISVGIPEQTIQHIPFTSDEQAIREVFETQNARVLFGDALRIIPLAERNKPYVQLTKTLYEKSPLTFAVPRNDVPFRILVEATLQEMYRDGTYQRLWRDLWGMDEPLKMIIMPGTGTPFGIRAVG